MAQILTLDDAKKSLAGHLADRGAAIHAKYGPHVGWAELQKILQDKECCRYPVEILFSGAALEDGEFAHPVAKSDDPNDGYVMHVHPFFATEPAAVPALVLYQLVLVNYGDFASPEDAETFGAAVLGIDPEAYYDQLCEMADMVSTGIATMEPQAAGHEHDHGGGCGGGCSCGG
jgi:hypothetical protein